MTIEELLTQFETQPDVERVRAMIALGQRDDEEAHALIAALEARGFYERRLALFSCYGSRDRAHVLRALNDPSAILRDLAARLVPLVCDDTQAQEALRIAPSQLRRPLLRRLLQRRRQTPIDAYISALAPNDTRFPRLLPLASPEIIHARADDFIRLARDVDWERLGSLRPAVALDLLERWLGAQDGAEGRPLRIVNALLPSLARVDPDRALALVRTLTRTVSLMRIQHLETLARVRPEAVVAVARGGRRIPVVPHVLIPALLHAGTDHRPARRVRAEPRPLRLPLVSASDARAARRCLYRDAPRPADLAGQHRGERRRRAATRITRARGAPPVEERAARP